MPIGDFEKAILRLLAANRNPESFVAGATVLLRDEQSHRRSQDIDLFHDTAESLKAAADADSAVLAKHGYQVTEPGSPSEKSGAAEASTANGPASP